MASGGGVLKNRKLDKLEKFTKNKKTKRILIGSVVGILILIGGLFLYKTYAYYEEEKEFNVLKGTIPEFGYDIKMLSVVIDEKKSNTIPERGMYKTNVHCTNGTFGEWDYNNWNLVLNNVSSDSKCNIEFTSGLSEEEYNKYIEAGKALHRNTYRGKDITSYLTDGSLYTRISNGTFEDIYVGDYIEANGVTWLIADIDNYLYSGDIPLTKHHVTIIPATPLIQNVSMNETNPIEGAYAESKMASVTLPSLVTSDGIIGKTFGEHILEYRNRLSNSIKNEIANKSGGNWLGTSNGWNWYSRKLDLMSEVNVFGTTIWSSSGFDTGIDNKQYAIFILRPELINSYNGTGFNYWLKDILADSHFAFVEGRGSSGYRSATNTSDVRPRFLIG